MKRQKTFLIIACLLLIGFAAFGLNEPVVFEAESGTSGSEMILGTDVAITYVTTSTVLVNGAYPGANRTITYQVTFPDSGTYDLFVRLKVGAATFDDDSYFYGNGFGTKDPAVEGDWITNNQLAVAGFVISTDAVSGQGSAAHNVWKWVNASEFTGYETPITFRVELGDLTQTFSIGARENGLSFDKFAFGRSELYYTVSNLDNGQPGSIYPPGEEPIGPPLAEGLSKFLGCSYGADSKDDFEGYWNQVTPGNAGKWGWVESTRDVMSWTDFDEAYNFAKENNFPFKWHVCFWGNQQPSWIEVLDSAAQREEIEEWIAAVADRYDSIDMIEVVNEPLHDAPSGTGNGNYIGALGGNGETGWDWIIEAFRIVRKYFPDTKLMLNEYNVVSNNDFANDYIEIAKLLQAEDTLIDAIGAQSHGFSLGASTATIQTSIDSLAATGLEVYITELDIDGITDKAQLQTYQRVFPIYWENPAVKGITLWGFRPGMWRTDTKAYLITAEGVERPAMTWLRAYLKGTFAPSESIAVSATGGIAEISSSGGTLKMLAEILPDTATIKNVVWSVSPSGIATIDTSGLLTAVKNGTVTVKASSMEYGSTVKGTLDVTVTNQLSGIENNEISNNVIIYPNPAVNGLINISGIDKISMIEILDLSGRTIKRFDGISQSSLELQLNVSQGIYIVRLYDGQNNLYKKIMVE